MYKDLLKDMYMFEQFCRDIGKRLIKLEDLDGKDIGKIEDIAELAGIEISEKPEDVLVLLYYNYLCSKWKDTIEVFKYIKFDINSGILMYLPEQKVNNRHLNSFNIFISSFAGSYNKCTVKTNFSRFDDKPILDEINRAFDDNFVNTDRLAELGDLYNVLRFFSPAYEVTNLDIINFRVIHQLECKFPFVNVILEEDYAKDVMLCIKRIAYYPCYNRDIY